MLKKNKGKLYQHSIREKIHIRQVNQELFDLNHTIIKLKENQHLTNPTPDFFFCFKFFSTIIERLLAAKEKGAVQF